MSRESRTNESITDPRRVVLELYVRELMHRSPSQLAVLVPPEPGTWGLPELERELREVRLGVMAFRPSDPDSALLFVVEVISARSIHKVFAEGFAVEAGGALRQMDAEEWAFLNI